MADEFNITVSGIDDVCKELSELPKSITKNVFARALAAAAVPVVQALRARCPVATGELRDHITTDIQIHAEGKGGTAQVGFGNEGYKARFIEYGHRIVGHAPNHKELGAVESKPFMRPATVASAEASITEFAEVV